MDFGFRYGEALQVGDSLLDARDIVLEAPDPVVAPIAEKTASNSVGMAMVDMELGQFFMDTLREDAADSADSALVRKHGVVLRLIDSVLAIRQGIDPTLPILGVPLSSFVRVAKLAGVAVNGRALTMYWKFRNGLSLLAQRTDLFFRAALWGRWTGFSEMSLELADGHLSTAPVAGEQTPGAEFFGALRALWTVPEHLSSSEFDFAPAAGSNDFWPATDTGSGFCVSTHVFNFTALVTESQVPERKEVNC